MAGVPEPHTGWTFITSHARVLAAIADDPNVRIRDIAAHWAHQAGRDLGMTSTSRDEPWLRVSAIAIDTAEPAQLVATATEDLVAELRRVGAAVVRWDQVEVLHEDEIERRRQQPPVPPMVTAAELATLAGLSSVQRIYQLESERRNGKREDFPAPVVDGYWLRSTAEHWAATRRRKPGPAPRA